jgi:hypothetical protein
MINGKECMEDYYLTYTDAKKLRNDPKSSAVRRIDAINAAVKKHVFFR